MARTPAELVKASYEAYVQNDRAAIEALLAEDFHFTSPLDNRIDRTTYFERCWPNHLHAERFDFIHLVSERDRVFVTYELHTTDGKKQRNTELTTVRGQQIVEVEVYFGWSIPHEAPSGGFTDHLDVR